VIKEVLRWSLAEITTEQKHRVLQGAGRPPRARPRLDREPSAPLSEFLSRSRASRARRLHTYSSGRGI
jgi:hypothetical protein